uniref:NB-ARC domain-containing protein n=1 Tax=Leersia perrieri TaxID=77586 RepID=A0A0D9WUW2_9ORYZ
MESTISAILTEFAGRSISFLLRKYLKQQQQQAPAPSDFERLDILQRLLLRLRIIIDEAQERFISNQAMLLQLSILRKEMFRGYYMLDTFRCRAHQSKDHHGEVSPSFAMSKFSSAKRIRFSSGSGNQGVSELQRVIQNLENTIADTNEFIVFLSNCPRLHRQPYNMYLILDQCMFGRQMEMEYLINFLLRPGNHVTQEPGVLPIIGPGRVGKSTLVEHACNDERVRNHFSQIMFFTQGNLEDESMADLRDGGVIKHRNHASDFGRVLVIIELDGDRYSEGLDKKIDEGLLERLYLTYKTYIPHDSKIIVTSRSDKIARLGTTPPLRLQLLSKEAYWYFFKVRTFGSMDAADHIEMESIAMDIAVETEGCFMGANVFSKLMRSNTNTHYWSLLLATLREFKKKNHHVWSFMYGADKVNAFEVTEPREEAAELLVILDNYQICSHASPHSEAESPKISILDVLFGSVKPRGRFDALGWKSQIPPYYQYNYSCEIKRPKCTLARKKKIHKNAPFCKGRRDSLANMEAAISAILTELAGRSISFLVGKYLNQQQPAPSNNERLECLQRLLLRFRIIVDEAEERCITNQAMLHQLSILRKEMFRGYYTLDTFRSRDHHGKVSSYFAISTFSSAKRIRFCSGDGSSKQSVSELQRVLWNLENTIADANEFVLFLSSCPRLHRQPYNMYLIFDQCMFGRQMEMEYLINFLLRPGNHGTQEPGVLPIIGRGRVGKSTLVEHACNDERVRNHFSQIVLFTRGDLEDENMVNLRDGGVTKHRNHALDVGRVLVIIELDGDRYSEELDKKINEGLFERLYSTYKTCIPRDSKIIVTSRSDKIARLGTTPPLRLQLLPEEAYWYFFKVCIFGSMDASEHPEIESVAMDLAIESERSFMAASVFGRLLRSNANPHYWRLVLASLRDFEKKNQHVWSFMYCADQVKDLEVTEPDGATESLVILDNFQIGSNASPKTEGPNISVMEVLLGGAKPQGRFDALGWKSQIAPYYSYMYTCEIQRSSSTAPSDVERLDSLQRLLLWLRTIIDEAREQCITNQSMLLQLSTQRKEMFRA